MQVQQVLDGFSSLPHRHISSPQRVCQLGCHHVYTLQRDIAGMAGLLAHLGSYAGVERQRKCRCHPGEECMMLHMQMQSGSEMHDTVCAAGIRFRRHDIAHARTYMECLVLTAGCHVCMNGTMSPSMNSDGKCATDAEYSQSLSLMCLSHVVQCRVQYG